MDRGNDRRYFEGVEPPSDTNIDSPWTLFLVHAFRREFMPSLGFLAVSLLPVVAVAGYGALTNPEAVLQFIPLLVVGSWLAASVLAERNLCRDVVIIRLEGDQPVIDHQRWWKADERLIPDEVKLWNGKRPVAWLYPVSVTGVDTGEVVTWFAPFSAWNEPLVIDEDSASAAHIAGIKTTMKASSDIARYQEPGRNDTARYGLLVVVILFGLLAAYMAGNEAIDKFLS